MSTDAALETVTGEVTLRVADESLKLRVTVRAGPSAVVDLLPLFHGVASALADRGVARDTAGDRVVSCRAGCGACCRQGVPVAPSEARALAALVDAMPEPRRSVVRSRFAAARATLAAAGASTQPGVLGALKPEEHGRWVANYFTAGVACPFLDDEACSIYPDRPTICREYLVTSPAENCRAPTRDSIRRVPIAGSVSAALIAVDRDPAGENHGPLLLVESLAWVATQPPLRPGKSGPELVQDVFASLAAKS